MKQSQTPEASRARMREQVSELSGRVEQVRQAAPGSPASDTVAELLAGLSALATEARSLGLDQAALLASAPVGNPPSAEAVAETLDRLQHVLSEETANLLSLSADTGMIRDFTVEARDHLAQIETQLLALEQNPADTDTVHTIFRGFHTIKGLASFLDLDAIRAVAHEVETLLDHVRTGGIPATPSLVDVVLGGADYLRADLDRVLQTLDGQDLAPADASALLARVQALMNPGAEPEPVVPAAVEPKADGRPETAEVPDQKKSVVAESKLIKVDTDRLDFLVDMVGELVIAQSMVWHDGQLNALASPKLQRNLAQLSRITGEVQKTAMSMRMVPIRQLFQKSARLVRDLTRKSGKQVELELSGEETELDRNIVEDLSDPLMHMLRNACDHGIEGPGQREASGKSSSASVRLKAYHQSGHIVIEIADDGRGMDREKLLDKARSKGLLTANTSETSGWTDKEVFSLIFEPGFSTAEKITDISGRGVGMDVVRKQIQKLRGRVEIDSEVGRGTTFLLKLPLTLAIIDGLVVGVGKERYIVPIFVVHEIFRPQANAVFTVEQRGVMLLVRGSLLPVIRLSECFGVEPVNQELAASVVVVAEGGGRRFCLVVDELIGKQEVVIKNLGETFKQVPGVAGGAILGDGRVGLIIDIDGLFSDGSAELHA